MSIDIYEHDQLPEPKYGTRPPDHVIGRDPRQDKNKSDLTNIRLRQEEQDESSKSGTTRTGNKR